MANKEPYWLLCPCDCLCLGIGAYYCLHGLRKCPYPFLVPNACAGRQESIIISGNKNGVSAIAPPFWLLYLGARCLGRRWEGALAPAPCNAKEGAPALSYSQKGVRRSKANEARGQLDLLFFIFYHCVHSDSSEACPPLARSLPASCNAKVREYSVLFLSLASPNSSAWTRFNLVGAPLFILCEWASLSSKNKIKYELRTPFYRENGVPTKLQYQNVPTEFSFGIGW